MADSPERREAKKPIREAVIFLLYKDGKVLLERRIKENSGFFGYVIIPGGGCEHGESLELTMLREIDEETGVRATKWEFLGSFEHMSLSGDHLLSHAYFVAEFDGEIENREPDKCNLFWVDLDDAESLLKLASSKLVLFKAKEIILAGQKED